MVASYVCIILLYLDSYNNNNIIVSLRVGLGKVLLNSPLKCGHSSNKDTFTGPKGGQFRGVPLYM